MRIFLFVMGLEILIIVFRSFLVISCVTFYPFALGCALMLLIAS